MFLQRTIDAFVGYYRHPMDTWSSNETEWNKKWCIWLIHKVKLHSWHVSCRTLFLGCRACWVWVKVLSWVLLIYTCICEQVDTEWWRGVQSFFSNQFVGDSCLPALREGIELKASAAWCHWQWPDNRPHWCRQSVTFGVSSDEHLSRPGWAQHMWSCSSWHS